MSSERFDGMTPGDHSSHDLKALEAALASLAPRPAALDRDRLMFEAGRASVSTVQAAAHGRWAWPAAFSGMSALAASLFLILMLRPPLVVERVVQARVVEEEREGEEATGPGGESRRPDDGATSGGGELARHGEEAKGREGESRRPGEGATRRGREEEPRPLGPSYLDLRDRVLAMGVDAWQPSGKLAIADSPPPATYRELLIEFGELR